MFSHFFIRRPIFASVVSIVFIILGGVAFFRLPVAQYPEIQPPIINVSGQYPGANADVIASTVVAPIEEQINGVENMLYMSSNSNGDGRFTIQVTFDIGTNLDIAQVQVQNRVAVAQPRLPQEVRQIGVNVAKSSPDLMMVVHLFSPDKSRDTLFISNYATLEIKDALIRVDGVGSITVFGSRDYAMRIWLDPDRLQSLGLTAGDVTRALQGQNVQVAGGVLNQPPIDRPGAFQIAVKTLGRLANPDEFAEIIVKQTPAAVVRLRDVAKIELAALDYGSNSYLDRDPAVALAVFQRPGSNALSPCACAWKRIARTAGFAAAARAGCGFASVLAAVPETSTSTRRFGCRHSVSCSGGGRTAHPFATSSTQAAHHDLRITICDSDPGGLRLQRYRAVPPLRSRDRPACRYAACAPHGEIIGSPLITVRCMTRRWRTSISVR